MLCIIIELNYKVVLYIIYLKSSYIEKIELEDFEMRRKNCFKTKAKPSRPNVLNCLLQDLNSLRLQRKREMPSRENRKKTFLSLLSSLYIKF
jgi:hypothetical protein